MKNVFKNWKTSLAGVVSTACVVLPMVAPQYAVVCNQVLGLAVSLGFISAKDGNKTGV